MTILYCTRGRREEGRHSVLIYVCGHAKLTRGGAGALVHGLSSSPSTLNDAIESDTIPPFMHVYARVYDRQIEAKAVHMRPCPAAL